MRATSTPARFLVLVTATVALAAGGLPALPVAAAGLARTFAVDWLTDPAAGPPVDVRHDSGWYRTTSPGMSDNGNRVVFVGSGPESTDASAPPSVTPNSIGNNVLLRDRVAGTTTLVSVTTAGEGTSAADNFGADQPVISGDGCTVAFASDDSAMAVDQVADGRSRVFVRNVCVAAPTTRQVLAVTTHADSLPALSRNGSRLAFVRESVASPVTVEIVVVDMTGATPALITTFPAGTGSASGVAGLRMSADGTRLAFNSQRQDGGTLHWFDVASPADHSLSVSRAEAPSLSADGRWLAYIERDSTGSFDNYGGNLFVLDLNTPDAAPRAVTMPKPNGYAGVCLAPAVSASGTTLTAVCATVGGMTSDGFLYQGGQIWQFRLGATPAEDVVSLVSVTVDGLPGGETDSRRAGFPAITPDASVIAFPSRDSRLHDAAAPARWELYAATAPDSNVPTFPTGALTASAVSTSFATLTWPAASDDTGVVGYELTKDGASLAGVAAGVRSYDVTGLAPSTDYAFAVRARDAAGNLSAPLTTTVRTAAAAQAGTAQLRATPRAGGHVLLAWDAADAAGLLGYQVLRATGSGTLTPVTSVGPGVATYDDSGLLAQTTYRYRIDAVRSSETAAHTAVASAVTPDLTAVSVTATPVFVRTTNLAALGSDVPIVLTGEPDRTATAVVTHPGGPTTVSLTQSSPGVYRGSFAIREGTSEITSVVGTLSDGAQSANLTAAGFPRAVSGAVDVTVTGATDAALEGLRGAVTSSAGNVAVQVPVTARRLFAAVPPADDVDVRLTFPDGFGAGRASAITATAGHVTPVSLPAVLAAALRVDVLGAGGSRAAVWRVEARDADGSVIGSGYSAPERGADLTGLVSGTAVDVTARLSGGSTAVLRSITGSVLLQRGANSIVLSETPLDRSTVTGRVTAGTAPVASGYVVVTQHVDGRDWSWYATTDDDGRYSVQVLAGPARVTAGHASRTEARTTTVAPAGGSTTVDVALPDPQYVTIGMRLFTRDGSAPEIEHVLDWRTWIHYRLSLTSLDDGPRGIHTSGGDTVVVARPGDRFQLCGDGVEGGLSRGCATVTAAVTGGRIEVALHLASAGQLVGRLLTTSGAPVTGPWSARVFPVMPDGSRGPARNVRGHDDRLSTPVISAGPSEVVVHTDGGLLSRAVRVSVPQDGVGDAGDIVLARSTAFNGEGNGVEAVTPVVYPGAVARFRAHFRNGGAAVSGATLRLGIPSGTTLVPGSVMVNGTPPAATPAVDEGSVPLAVGTIAEGVGGVVTYAVQTSSGTTSGGVTSVVRMTSSAGDAFVGSATAAVVGLSLAAPSRTVTPNVVVSGHAPPGVVVDIHDGPALIGQATAGPGGLWTAAVLLVTKPAGVAHALQATAPYDGGLLSSSVAYTRYDRDYPHPTSITLSQSGGRPVKLDPSTGVARFPFVFVPGVKLSVQAVFSEPDRVSNVRVRIGSAPSSSASCDGGCSSSVSAGAGDLGPVFLDYDVTAKPFSLADFSGPRPSLEAGRGQLPPGVARFTNPIVTEDPQAHVGSVQVGLPAAGANATLSTTMRVRRGLTRILTSDDVSAAAESGVPVYGASLTGGIGPSTSAVRLVAYLPDELLGDATTPAAALRRLSTQRYRVVVHAAPNEAVKVAELIFEVGSKGYDSADGLNSALEGGDVYSQLGDLIEAVGPCPNDISGLVERQAQEIANTQAGMHLLSAGAAIAGLVFAPVTFGASLAVWGAQTMVSKGLDAGIAKRVKNLAKYVESLDCSKKKTSRSDLIADPSWIFDPSGYVYEAFTANRLEGVTATVLERPNGSTTWRVWEAEPFGQVNPQLTDPEGRYGWNVPDADWQVLWTKPGYAPARSAVFHVLPERTDVNAGMVRLAPPAVDAVTATVGEVRLVFDTWMRTTTVPARVTVTDAGGAPVAGVLTPVDPKADPIGRQLARTFRFVPSTPRATGDVLTVGVEPTVQDYDGAMMAGGVTRTVTVLAVESSTPPSTGGGGTPAASATASPRPTVPAPTRSSTPSGSPLGSCAAGPTVTHAGPAAVAGRPVPVTVRGRAGDRVQLLGYVRPATSYRLLRTAVLPATGAVTFSLQPQGNLRVFAISAGCPAGRTLGIPVAAAVTLAVTRVGGLTVLRGAATPVRPGQRVEVFLRTPKGDRMLSTARTDRLGRYVLTRASLRGGELVVARVAATPINAAGVSAPRRVR